MNSETYINRNGDICPRVNHERVNKWADINTDEVAWNFYESLRRKVFRADIAPDGDLIKKSHDLRIIMPNGEEKRVEVGGKDDEGEKYINWKLAVNNGLTIEARKIELLQIFSHLQTIFYWVNREKTEALIVPGECALAAFVDCDCGKEFNHWRCGYSANFVMPKHGNHKIKKPADGKWEPFYHIRPEYQTHLQIIDNGRQHKVLKYGVKFDPTASYKDIQAAIEENRELELYKI